MDSRKTTTRALGGLCVLLLLLLVACGAEISAKRHAPWGPLAAVEQSFAHDATVASLLVAREEAFVRGERDAADPESRGRIVSEGWRSAARNQFSDLGARLPDAADGVMDVGLSRFATRHLRIALVGAHSSPATLANGRVVYRDAFASTDRVVVSDHATLEEFLVLYDDRAPRSFTWNVQLPDSVARVTRRDGGLLFEDARAAPLLAMGTPTARDVAAWPQ